MHLFFPNLRLLKILRREAAGEEQVVEIEEDECECEKSPKLEFDRQGFVRNWNVNANIEMSFEAGGLENLKR